MSLFLGLLLVVATAWTSPPLEPSFGSAAHFDRGLASQQSGEPVIRSEVGLQTVDVRVKDSHGNDVLGLSAKDFTVREDGKPQEIAFFDAGSGPVTVAVLVDSSSSVGSSAQVGSAEEVAARFMHLARPGDEIWAMDFTEWTGPFERLTPRQLLSPGQVTVPPAGGVGSAIYDAIATAVCNLRGSKNPRQAIIVITDGIDEHSRISLERLIDVIRSQRAQLFLIGLPSRPEFRIPEPAQPKVTLVTGHDIDNPDVVFDRLAQEAGAETFIPKSENGLQDALKAVSNLLESEYTLAYYLPKISHKLRRIEVKVNRRRVRVLPGLVVSSQDSAELVHFVEGTCAVSPNFHPYPYESHVTEGPSGMVYRDDFSDRSSGWPQHPDSHYVSAGYELTTFERTVADSTPRPNISALGLTTGRTTIYRENVVAAYGPSWRDFRVSATMRPVLGHASNGQEQKFTRQVRAAAGLVFRMNQEGYYALLLGGPPKDKNFSLELVARQFQADSYAESVVVPWTSIDRALPFEMTLAVEDIGDHITVFVDGKKVGSARDDRFSEGYVGFTVSAAARATFGNFVVEQK
jgi:Ca-activated chloride channel family protein